MLAHVGHRYPQELHCYVLFAIEVNLIVSHGNSPWSIHIWIEPVRGLWSLAQEPRRPWLFFRQNHRTSHFLKFQFSALSVFYLSSCCLWNDWPSQQRCTLHHFTALFGQSASSLSERHMFSHEALRYLRHWPGFRVFGRRTLIRSNAACQACLQASTW